MSAEVRHVPFNPQPFGLHDSPLGRVCEHLETDGWRLVQVVPVHQHEAVAVFERAAEKERSDG